MTLGMLILILFLAWILGFIGYRVYLMKTLRLGFLEDILEALGSYFIITVFFALVGALMLYVLLSILVYWDTSL